ncbi:MAG: restriction endonuclease subunit S [Amaricoccus sp.]|uniref:restriction endonuclease subunit S n=1 Tax=Amaricoccus sp. TaxID=1872485 RepID=UPI003314CA81
MSEATPKLRFPGFDQPWKPAHAGDAFRSSRARGRDGLPIYSVTLDRGLVPRASLDRHLAADAADEQNLRAQPGDLVYNTMRMWQGAVGRAEVECMVSPAYVVLSPKKGVSSAFFDYWFQHPRMRHLLGAYSHGLTSDRLRLYPDDFAQIPLSLPGPSEQERIASAIKSADRKIALLREEQDALEAYKAGLLDRLFSRKVRFRRDDGTDFPDWRPARFGSVLSFVRTNSLSRERLSDAGEIANIHYGDIHRHLPLLIRRDREQFSYLQANDAEGLLEVDFCRPGDLIIADASEDLADIGKTVEIIQTGRRDLVAGLHTMLARPLDGVFALGFAGHMMATTAVRRQIHRLAQGVSVYGLSRSNVAGLTIELPCSEEQEKIAAVLGALEGNIASTSLLIERADDFRRGLIRGLYP